MNRCFTIAVFSSMMLVAQASTVLAHAFHITVAEAEVNPKTGRIEVAMRVHPGDLELALGRMANRRIRLEKEPKIDALITDYLQRSVQLQSESSYTKSLKPKSAQPKSTAHSDRESSANKKSKPPKIQWVGKEVSVKWAWLYFEIPTVKDLNGARITNRVFHEILADQENTIILKDGKRKQTLVCRKSKPTAKIDLRSEVQR